MGFSHAEGFDEYGDAFCDRKVLTKRYDCVFSQDVIEHVPSPVALLDTFHELARPGALVAIGTPDANALDLKRADAFLHQMHAPYHRHILSKGALLDAARARGWTLARFYSTMYSNTRFPGLNEGFGTYYLRLLGDEIDGLVEPVRVDLLLRDLPRAVYFALFGSLHSRSTDIMAIFRTAVATGARNAS
jgi:SAM-dependent methyltransferase